MLSGNAWLIAHRGASLDCPENTLAAFQEAWAQGADGIETDLRLTVDGRIVCVHDPTMARTGGLARRVDQMTQAALGALDVGSWKDARWADARVPELGEVLATVPPGKHVFLEVKTGPELLPALSEALAASPVAANKIVVMSFDRRVIEGFRERHPLMRTFWLTELGRSGARWLPGVDAILDTLESCGADGVGASAHEALNSEFVGRILDAGFGFHVWTVDDPGRGRKLLEMGVQSLTTNCPGRMRTALSI